jgi:hypothetical protein
VRRLRQQLARWALLALALGRRAVVPLVTCDIPTPEVPVELRNSVVLVKLAGRSLCGAGPAAAASWRLQATVPAEPSHEHLAQTTEMGALGDYRDVMAWPPPHQESCCQLVPEIRCIDRYAESGELRDELLLCERDLGWIDAAEDAAAHEPSVARPTSPHQPLTLDGLRRFSGSRTLVIDLGSTQHKGVAAALEDAFEPLAMLPAHAEVEAAIAAVLTAAKAARRSSSRQTRRRRQDEAAASLPMLDLISAKRRCVQRLLEAAATSGADAKQG